MNKNFGGVKAVVSVSFDLHEGELLGVIGPNGSGKTTLVNLITGFIKPDSGKIEYRGRDITGWPPYRIARIGIARTFQMIRPFAELPSFKNLIIPLYSPRVRALSGGKYGDLDAVAKDYLEDVGFERESSVTYKPAGSLPHGYLKRLELAKCLALRADLIILDELFSGLSIAELASIIPIIEKLVSEGKSVIMIEHRLRELFRIADRIVVLNYGSVIADGVPSEVMEKPEVRMAYLGSE
ncbi:MAG: ABC transporter ATP-binding protein [Deltaproteobacteria bacterium]|nr:ABC transporter ATP-binding protein [Deltaproteobacteria bacterium]